MLWTDQDSKRVSPVCAFAILAPSPFPNLAFVGCSQSHTSTVGAQKWTTSSRRPWESTLRRRRWRRSDRRSRSGLRQRKSAKDKRSRLLPQQRLQSKMQNSKSSSNKSRLPRWSLCESVLSSSSKRLPTFSSSSKKRRQRQRQQGCSRRIGFLWSLCLGQDLPLSCLRRLWRRCLLLSSHNKHRQKSSTA